MEGKRDQTVGGAERVSVEHANQAGVAVSSCLLDMALAASCRPLAARFAAQPTGCPGETLRGWSLGLPLDWLQLKERRMDLG